MGCRTSRRMCLTTISSSSSMTSRQSSMYSRRPPRSQPLLHTTMAPHWAHICPLDKVTLCCRHYPPSSPPPTTTPPHTHHICTTPHVYTRTPTAIIADGVHLCASAVIYRECTVEGAESSQSKVSIKQAISALIDSGNNGEISNCTETPRAVQRRHCQPVPSRCFVFGHQFSGYGEVTLIGS